MLDNLIIMLIFWFDPDGLFRLYLLLKHSSSKFSADDFLSKASTLLKQDLQIRQDCLSTSIVWRINWEILARPSWLSKSTHEAIAECVSDIFTTF